MPPAVQSVRFPRALWSQRAARAWLRTHGFVPIKPVDVTAGQLRYRMRDPADLRDYIVKKLGGAGDIQLVIGLKEVTGSRPRRPAARSARGPARA